MDEQLVQEIKARVLRKLIEAEFAAHPMEIPVGISVRHVHLSQEDLEHLYGPGHQLTKLRDLRQPGEFAAKEVVALVGPRMRTIENVRILGPCRDQTQVELARTDAIVLGLNPPVRQSGNLAGSSPITLIGPKGALSLPEGCIVANRHIHMNPQDAGRLGVKDNDIVSVEVTGDKGLVFHNVQVRVREGWVLEMHLDTDDANAACITCGVQARIRPEVA
ncbi:MAG: phosphate propanoyltransferase [Limnochordia bacterium]|jgi:putative phosphotransacetylase